MQIAMITMLEAQNKETIILVHGAGHGAWSWSKTIPLLNAKKVPVLAIDLPGQNKDTSKLINQNLLTDAQAIQQLANSINGKVILVGHSSGGVAIAQAAELLGTNKVSKLVFLDAFMPRNGQSVKDLAEQAAKSSQTPAKENTAPTMLFTANFTAFQWNPDIVEDHFYHDCSKADQVVAKSQLSWQALACIGTPVQVSDQVYGAIPKYYILCTQARDLDKRSIANNLPIQKLYELPSSHSPFFSMPEKLVDLLVELYHQ